MYFLIFNINNKQLLFSTIDFSSFSKKIFDNVDVNNKDIVIKKQLAEFQFLATIKEDLLFVIIQLFDGFMIKHDIVRTKKIRLDDFKFLINKFSNIFTNQEISLLKKGQSEILDKKLKAGDLTINHLQNNIFIKKIYKEHFPFDSEILLLGDESSGLTTIFYLLSGLTISSFNMDRQIPHKDIFNKKRIMLKKFNIGRGMISIFKDIILEESNIIYIIDSNKKVNPNHPIKRFLKLNKDQKILIIANKQDLPNAMDPKEIENILGFPTIGFSAILSDAIELFKKILLNYLNR